MKVFVVDPSFFSLPYDLHFCAALVRAGHEVTLIGRRLRPYEEVHAERFAIRPLFYGLSERLPARLRLLARPLKGIEHVIGMASLTRLVRRAQPDVLHWQWIVLPRVDGFFFRHLARRLPLVLTVHNSVPFHGSSSARLMLEGHERAFKSASHFVAHTADIARYLEKQGIAAANCTILAHPALDLPAPVIKPRTDDLVHILFFGTIKPYKGVDILVEAGLRLAARRRDFHITVAGRPFCDLDGLRRRIGEDGAGTSFTFDLRHLPEQALADRLAGTDIVVFPYREIDASGAFACASRFGKPVVASAIGVFADPPVAEHVMLVPPADPPALADALERLITDPALRARQAASSRALEGRMYDWRQFALDCGTIYRHLVESRMTADAFRARKARPSRDARP